MEIGDIYRMSDHYEFYELLDFMLEDEKKALDMTSTEVEVLGLRYRDALDRRDAAALSVYGAVKSFESDRPEQAAIHPSLVHARSQLDTIFRRVDDVFSKKTRDRALRDDFWDDEFLPRLNAARSQFITVCLVFDHFKNSDRVCKRWWISVAATCRTWTRKGYSGLSELLNLPSDTVDHLSSLTNHQFYEKY